MAPKHKGGDGRQARPGKPGWYRVQASDLLHSMQLRHDLKLEVLGIRACLDKILKKYDLSAKDKQAIKKCLQDLEGATKPIAFGVGGASDNP
jgi:hypothetical protein